MYQDFGPYDRRALSVFYLYIRRVDAATVNQGWPVRPKFWRH